MFIGVGYVTIQVFESHSLKEKRRVVRSLIERARHRFNAGIAEVDYQDSWQLSGIAVTCVSSSAQHADQMITEILNFMERNVAFGSVADRFTEIIPFD